jgi:hypothetical protein
MVDITEVSAIVAAAGVLVGVVLNVLELRHLRKQRQTDLVVKLYSAFTSDDFLKSLEVLHRKARASCVTLLSL